MKWTITMHTEKQLVNNDFVDEEKVSTFECPFAYMQTVYYTYPEKRIFRKDRWVVRKSMVTSV